MAAATIICNYVSVSNEISVITLTVHNGIN